jgi:hypothetical protein
MDNNNNNDNDNDKILFFERRRIPNFYQAMTRSIISPNALQVEIMLILVVVAIETTMTMAIQRE